MDTGCIADTYSQAFDYAEDNPRNWRSGFAVLTFAMKRLLLPRTGHRITGLTSSLRGYSLVDAPKTPRKPSSPIRDKKGHPHFGSRDGLPSGGSMVNPSMLCRGGMEPVMDASESSEVEALRRAPTTLRLSNAMGNGQWHPRDRLTRSG